MVLMMQSGDGGGGGTWLQVHTISATISVVVLLHQEGASNELETLKSSTLTLHLPPISFPATFD